MDTLYRLADRCDEAADLLDTVAQRVTWIDPPASAFGVEAPGRLGDVAGALREQWLAATGGRQREAVRLAARLADMAAALCTTAADYATADAAAGRRIVVEE